MFDELFGKKKFESKPLFSLHAELHPYALKANKSDYVDLEVTLHNNSESELLTSLVAVVPKGLGFERSAISHEKEARLGYMAPGQSRFVKLQLWSTERTERGGYPVRLFAISHYKDYAHVLNEARKVIDLRVE